MMTTPLFPDVTVNGQVIASVDITAEAQNHPAPKNKPGLAWRAAARALVVRTLLLQAAAQQGLKAMPEMVDETHAETDEDALIRAYLDDALVPTDISEADCARAYGARPQQFRSPDLFEASHILLAAKSNEAKAISEARTLAATILKSVLAEPGSFAHHAKTSSDCSSAENGGRLGQLRPGDTVPEFEAALDALKVGEITPEPVETQFGLHIIRLDNKADGKVLPFEAIKPQILEALEKAAWAGAARDLVAGLIKAAVIEGIDLSDPAIPEVA